MPGRLDQARARYGGVTKRRMNRLAELVANGSGISEAGALMGITRGQAARTWADIKRGLGPQAR